MQKFNEQDTVDVVVIATGAGGEPILASLAHAGLKVVALEAGKQWNPQQEFATDENAQAPLFWMDERLSAGKDPVQFGCNNSGTGVGGSTLHFTAYTPRAQADDFKIKTESGLGSDWPIGYKDLEPFYEAAEQFIGVSGPDIYPWGSRRKQGYPLPPLPINGAGLLMQRGCEEAGIKTSAAPNAALSQNYYQEGVGWRKACTNRGFCQAGCNNGAKGSMDVTYIPFAVQHGAEVRAECYATHLDVKGGKITGVTYRHNGKDHHQKCKAVFLCAGGIETPRFLLMQGIANSSGQVGKNFMAHTGMQVWGRFNEMVHPWKGIPGAIISEDFHRPADADFAGGYLLQSIGVMPITYAMQVARGRGLWGRAMQEHMAHYNHFAGINILGDCLPYEHNYMELSDEKDDRGLPKPRIHFTWGENEKRLTAHAERWMRTIWEAAGAKDIWSYNRSAHIIGTCRMGTDASSAVVNEWCQSFDIPNMYICDNSVFPSALAVNPSLTIIALALRTAKQFISTGKAA